MINSQSKLVLVLLALTQVPTIAQAAGNNFGKGYAGSSYAGINMLFTSYSIDAAPELGDFKMNLLSAKLGYYMTEYLSGEIRGGFGISDDTVQGVTIEADHMLGAYIRGGFPVTEAFYPYAIAGMTQTKLTVSGGSFSASDSESDVSYGFGADFNITPFFTINGEWMNFYDKDGENIDGFSIGLSTQF